MEEYEMNAQSKVSAIAPSGAPGPVMNGAGSRLRPAGDSPAIARDIDLSAIIRAERITGIHYDRHLDRFTVHLHDYSCGGGATVGEALVKAQAMSARQ
jgi:hypothetical protein